MKGIDWLDSVSQKGEIFSDGLIQKIDESKNQKNQLYFLNELDGIRSTTATIIYNDIDEQVYKKFLLNL